MRSSYKIIPAIFLVLLISCKTGPFTAKRNDMFVIVYDYDNTAIQGTSIYINNKKKGETDIQGRYLLDLKTGETYVIKIEKRGYSSVTQEFKYDPFYVLYFQIGNATQYLRLAEESLDDKNYDTALENVKLSLELDPARIDTLFLQSIIYYKLSKNDEAKDILEQLRHKVSSKEYLDMFLDKLTVQP